ncbi:DUF5704 domain-containing protein [Paenibacillus sp. GM2]|uniref:DUF5704 domain-containing protein n=1 Tax=Paenibacillus sp. GM2 TaxID=1622070 RepID=UPI000840CC2C|nr:DUF5704 domain-containing protein [Paenibacillus sp. GM2]
MFSKKWFISLFALIVAVTSAVIIIPSKVEAAIGPSRMLQDEKDENIYYFVGMVYYEVWKNASNTWTNGVGPGDRVLIDGFDYTFQFNSNRKIKDIQVSQFTYLEYKWEEIFNKSRTGELEERPLQEYLRATSKENYTYSNTDKWTGKGTNVGFFSVYVTKGYLGADRPIDRRAEEEAKGQQFSKGVEGWRYYFPTLFIITLEPAEGKAVIKHFTTKGDPLNGIDGFKDYEVKLEKDQQYVFEATPSTVTWEYQGYKASNQKAPSGGEIKPGKPPTIVYSGTYSIYYLYLYYADEPDSCVLDPNESGCGPPPPPPGSVDCTDPLPGQSIAGEDLYPNVSAVIKADSRENERFNVLDGVPTTESLYGNVWSKDYLSKYEYQQMVGKCTFEVNVTVMPSPSAPSEPTPDPNPDHGEDAGESGTTVQVIVEKEYSYWTIERIKIYQIKESALWNYAFNNGGIRIQPSGYNAPYYSTAQTAGYEPSSVPEDITVNFDADPQAAAESAVYVNVNNDTFIFYNQTLMSGSTTSNHGPTPRPIPIATMTGDNVIYSPNNVIPMSKTNKANEPSSGTIYYEQVNGSDTMNFAIYGINPVTVHTPVVIYPGVSDDKAHNQKTNPALNRSAVILERLFTVQMPNSGQHAKYLGYGNRDYLNYIGSKQIRFPFDVYNEAKTKFYPKNTWIEVEKSEEFFTFYLPVWVDEGFYDVEFQTVAHNAPAGATHETNANLNLSHHIAYAIVPVDVIGRVYDFHVTDIADYNWESVFRTEIGQALSTGVSYWVGLNGIDGVTRGNMERYTLPIRPGSHPIYKNAVIKSGYHFKFDLKTKGNMFGAQDQIRITPTFYFVSAQDGKRTPVDLYYHTGRSSYVRIGSPMDEVERYVVLNERLRNVPDEELTDTALYKYDHEYTFGQVANIGRAQYVQYYKEKMTKQKTIIGRLSLLQLPANVRTLLGPKNGLPVGVDSARANASIQRWYGEYSLPAELFAVEAGTNVAEYGRTHQGLTDKSPIFLKEGYIVVNFNIETIRDGQIDKPYLQYVYAPLMNQWQQMEGFRRKITDPYGRTFTMMDGDIVFYHADQSSRDDFQSMVTH